MRVPLWSLNCRVGGVRRRGADSNFNNLNSYANKGYGHGNLLGARDGEAVAQPVSRNNYTCRECEKQWDVLIHLG